MNGPRGNCYLMGVSVDGGGRAMMIVDDDLMSREVLALLAAEAGWSAEGFASGEAAIAWLAEGGARPAVVLVDMQMPGISGDSLGKLLRVGCGAETQILAMSGTAVPADRRREFDGFLLKPFAMDDVARAVEGVAGPTVADPADTPSISEETFTSLAQSMPAAQLRQLYAMCLDDADQRLEKMRVASQAGDDDAFRRGAHSVKGGCGMVGALELAALAADMEERAMPVSSDEAPFTRFLAASARLRRILNARI